MNFKASWHWEQTIRDLFKYIDELRSQLDKLRADILRELAGPGSNPALLSYHDSSIKT